MELLKRLRSILLYLFISAASLNAQWTVPTDTTGTDLILLKAQFTDSMNNYRTGFYLDTTRIDTSQWGSFVRDHQTINFSTAGAITDSLDKYRTAYKLDTTAIDTAMFGKFVRDHESTAPDEVGDISSVTAGDGLSGGGITGDLTIAVKLSAIGGLEISGDSLRTKLDGTTLAKSSAGLKVDTTKMATQYDVGLKQDVADTSAKDATRYWVTTQGYLTTETGDIAGVIAGNWLSGGGTTGTVTLAVDTTKSASVYDLTLKQDVADTSVKDATRYWVQSQGYGTGSGDIEGVTAGVGISGGGTTGTVTVNVDTTAIAAKVWVAKAVRDSLDFYRTNYKLDTTKVDTSQWGKFVRDHESSPDGGGISAAALTDSLDKYRTAYKLDTTAIDTSQWHKIIRDWSDGGTYSLADNAVTTAKIDTAAAGWYDVRKFGAVGDSTTDNTTAIRNALKYVHNAGGGVLMFPGGPETIYGFKDSISVFSNTTLTSDGAWVKNIGVGGLGMFRMNDADNIIFNRFNINGNELQENVIVGGCDNLTITDCNIKNAGDWSVRSISDTNVVIRNNKFWNCNTPLGIWSVSNLRVENNIIDNRLYDQDTFGGVESGITLVTGSDIWITGNTWYRDVDSSYTTATESIYINDASGDVNNITIANNKIYCASGNQFGISLSASAHGIKNAWITGNYIEGSRTIGAIEPGGVDHLVIADNIIKDTFAGPDIALNGSCNNVKITGNVFLNSPYCSISGQPLHTDVVIDGNIIHGSLTNRGISLKSVKNLLVSNNIIDSTLTGIGVQGNDITIIGNKLNYVTGGNGAMGVNNSHRVIISDNNFNECGGSGFATIFTSGIYDIKLSGNKLNKCNRFIYDGGHGIDRATISDNVIMYNTAEANSAISLTGSQRTTIINNTMIGGDIAFVSLASASNDTVYAPKISGNTIIADSTTAERSHNSISLASVKHAEISNNSIYIKRGYDAWSWVPLVTLSGNSDSCVVKNNTITGDSVAVWATTAIYLADSRADHNIISGNVIRGFDKGIHNNSNRSGNIVTDNEVTNCTTPYEQAGGAIGIRSRYYSASDSSLAFIIWNPTLARADTVFAKQP